MKPRAPLLHPLTLASGHRHEIDPSGKHHYQSTDATSALAARFEFTLSSIGNLDALPPHCGLLLTLPARELVFVPSNVRRAAAGLGQLYAHASFAALEWELPNGWRDRRFLSNASLHLLRQLSAPPTFTTKNWQEATAILGNVLNDVPHRELWSHYCACASAWWSFKLPTLLWSHCCWIEPLQPLTRSTWARHLTALPLAARSDAISVESSATRDAYFASEGQSLKTTTLATLEAIVRRAASAPTARATFAERVILDARTLLPEAAREGRIQVLLIGFLVDLVENGGVRGRLSISAILDYAGQTIRRLFNALTRTTRDLNALGAWDWWTVYQTVIESARPSQRGKVGATLHAFHDYLQWLGVPNLPRGLGNHEPHRPPRAEVLWSHEGGRAIEWLRLNASPNDRANEQAQVVILLILDMMVRIDEVLGLRVGDVLATPAGLTLLVYPRIADGRIKAGDVRHPVDLESRQAIDALREWTHRRLNTEGAALDDFLFGAPRIKRSRFEHGRTYAWLEAALKVASGERSVSSHAARHRKGSQDSAEICMPHKSMVDINGIDQISAAAGQGVTQSLRETYINIFEEPLHAHAMRQLDDAHDHVQLPGWLQPIDSVVPMDATESWKRIRIRLPDATIGMTQVLEAIEDLGNDLTTEAVASRTGLSSTQVEEILLAAAKAFQSMLPDSQQMAVDADDSSTLRLVLMEQLPLILATRHCKFNALRKWIDTAPSSDSSRATLAAALSEWKPLIKDAHLSMEKPESASHLLRMLRESGLASDRILITHAIPRQALPDVLRRSGWHLRSETKVRRGQPRVRLHICSVAASSPSAIDRAISNKGFYGLLIAAEVRTQLFLTRSK